MFVPQDHQAALPLERLITREPAGEEAIPVDVLFVGAGPAGLAGAIRLAQRVRQDAAKGTGPGEIEIGVLEKSESLGEHNYFFEHGWYPYNATAWIPFVVYWPGVPDPGRRVTYPVSLINLVPTITDLMQWTMPEAVPFQGRSLAPVLVDGEDRVDDYVIVEAGEIFRPYKGAAGVVLDDEEAVEVKAGRVDLEDFGTGVEIDKAHK